MSAAQTTTIPLARPSIGDAERSAADRALCSGRLVLGPENERFEELLAQRCGRAHAVAVTSGTGALELALWAMGLELGDEVLICAFGFVAAANAVARFGARPMPVDVKARDWTIDLESAASAVTPRTRGIISIDQLGVVAEAAELETFASTHGLWLIDDAACGLGGCDSKGIVGGSYGELGTLSFHPRKVITTGEGGAVVTDDDKLAAVLRSLRNHGQCGSGVFDRQGTNARLGEIAAAIGAAQLHRLDDMLAERRLLARGYGERLQRLVDRGRLSVQTLQGDAEHSYQSFAVLLADDCDRDKVRSHLFSRDIESGPATYAFHRVGVHSGGHQSLPVADALHERSLSLPMYVGMRSAELDRIAAALTEVSL